MNMEVYRPDPERVKAAFEKYARVMAHAKGPPCNCDRFGCPGDHSEHYRRKAALRRLIDRELGQ